MRHNLFTFVALFSALTFGVPFEAFATPKRDLMASTKRKQKFYAKAQNSDSYSDESDTNIDDDPRGKVQTKFKNHSYVRIQQLPFLGMAAVSDEGVLDIEVMQAVNKNFHIGPTTVFHYGMQGDTKMKSINLGVRADFILPDFGNIGEVYFSSAFMLGKYSSSTKIVTQELQEGGSQFNDFKEVVTCDYQREGFHRLGAFVAGKIWRVSESTHLTTGLGAVRTKTFNGTTKGSGQCSDRGVTESEGTTLPWVDFGVGFNI
jgi:hypothetical protein